MLPKQPGSRPTRKLRARGRRRLAPVRSLARHLHSGTSVGNSSSARRPRGPPNSSATSSNSSTAAIAAPGGPSSSSRSRPNANTNRKQKPVFRHTHDQSLDTLPPTPTAPLTPLISTSTHVVLSYNSLSHLTHLVALAPQATHLHLTSNFLRTPALRQLDKFESQLFRLELGSNLLGPGLGGIVVLRGLRILGLESNRIEELRGISRLRELKELNVSGNFLGVRVSAEGAGAVRKKGDWWKELWSLRKLKHLQIGGNSIGFGEDADEAQQAQEAESEGETTSPKWVCGTTGAARTGKRPSGPRLDELDLSRNRVGSSGVQFGPLVRATIGILRMSNVGLGSIRWLVRSVPALSARKRVLYQWKNLKELHLDHNRIVDQTFPKRRTWGRCIPMLEVLDVSDNNLGTLTDFIDALRDLSRLIVVKIAGNPLCHDAEYVQVILEELPSLHIVDDCEREFEETQLDEKYGFIQEMGLDLALPIDELEKQFMQKLKQNSRPEHIRTTTTPRKVPSSPSNEALGSPKVGEALRSVTLDVERLVADRRTPKTSRSDVETMLSSSFSSSPKKEPETPIDEVALAEETSKLLDPIEKMIAEMDARLEARKKALFPENPLPDPDSPVARPSSRGRPRTAGGSRRPVHPLSKLSSVSRSTHAEHRRLEEEMEKKNAALDADFVEVKRLYETCRKASSDVEVKLRSIVSDFGLDWEEYQPKPPAPAPEDIETPRPPSRQGVDAPPIESVSVAIADGGVETARGSGIRDLISSRARTSHGRTNRPRTAGDDGSGASSKSARGPSQRGASSRRRGMPNSASASASSGRRGRPSTSVVGSKAPEPMPSSEVDVSKSLFERKKQVPWARTSRDVLRKLQVRGVQRPRRHRQRGRRRLRPRLMEGPAGDGGGRGREPQKN